MSLYKALAKAIADRFSYLIYSVEKTLPVKCTYKDFHDPSYQVELLWHLQYLQLSAIGPLVSDANF